MSKYEPNVHHSNIGSSRQFPHHTKQRKYWSLINLMNLPYKESGGDQQNGQVDCHCGLEVERFEECGGIGHQQQEEGGEVGGQ